MGAPGGPGESGYGIEHEDRDRTFRLPCPVCRRRAPELRQEELAEALRERRIKAINRVRLYRPGYGDCYPQLGAAMMNRPIRWELIADQYGHMIKYATSRPV